MAGSFLPPVVAVLAANTTQFSAKMLEAKGEMASVVDSSSKLGLAGKASLAGLAAAAGTVAVAAIHMGTEYQTQLTRLYTAAGAPKQAVLENSNAILSLATSVGQTGTAMAEALYHPISAGLDMATSLQVVKYAAQEAQISGASLEDTTYSLSSVMKAFNQPASQAEQTMASLNAIVGEGDMRFQDFNESVKNWAPTAAQMGISINSMGAGLAYLTDRGNSAEVAATRLTMGISMMTTPSGQAAKMLEGLGVASGDVKASSAAMEQAMKKANITQNKLAADLKQPDGLYVALKDLQDGLKKAGVSGTEADSVLAKIFGGGRSDKAIMSLMQNLDGLKSKFDAISKDSTAQKFQQNWDDAKKTFGFQMQQIKAAAENALTHLGVALLPKLSSFISEVGTKGGQAIRQFMQGFSGGASNTGLQRLGQFIRGITDDLSKFGRDAIDAFKNLASAVGPAAKVVGVEFLGAIKAAAGFLSTVVGPAIKAVSQFFKDHQGIVTALVQVALIPLEAKLIALPFKKTADAAKGLFDAFSGGVKSVQNSVKIITDFGKGVVDTSKAVGGFASDFIKGLQGVEDAANTWGGKIGGIFSTVGSGLGRLLTTIGSAARAFGLVMMETVFPALVSAASATWSFTVALLANPITWIVLAVIALGIAVYELITHWSQVSAFFKGLWSDVKKIFDDATKWIGQRIDDIVNFFQQLHDRISTWISKLGDTLKQGWDHALSGAKQWLSNMWSQISGWFSALPGRIGGFFSDAASWLVDAGKNVVIGLWNGLVSMGGWLWDHIWAWIKSVIPGPVKAALGISSPSKVAYELIRWVPLGMVRSMDDHSSLVAAASRRLAASAVSGIGGYTAGGTGTVGGYSSAVAAGASGVPGGVTINIQTGALLSTKGDIKRAVQEAFLQNNMRNVQNGLTFSVA